MTIQSHAPDLIVLAKACYTLQPRRNAVQGLAIRAGRIVATGTHRTLQRLKGRATRLLDLGRGVVTPGLVDCHTHLLYWALHRAAAIDLSKCKTRAAAISRIQRQASRRHFGEWIVAGGFDYNTWPEGMPAARDLDGCFPSQPVLARTRDGHGAWLNSAALKRAGITARTPDPKGGRILRDTRGRPTGMLQETAVELLPDPIRELAERTDAASLRTVDRALSRASRIARSLGIVGVHVMDEAASLTHFQRHHRESRLILRVTHAVPLSGLPHAIALGLRTGLGDDWLRIGAVKVFADGALGSQTAYMFGPYPNSDGNRGVPVVAGDELRQVAVEAAAHGLALWVHAIGDRAVHETVMALAAARRAEGKPLPHRIEHAQCARPADVRRMARLGIIASVQPCHILGDIRTAERHWPRASRNAYALRAMLDAGVTLAMGSDVPIESIDPRRSLFAAANRTEPGGYPEGGWYPSQRLAPVDVLRGFTQGAAASIGRSSLAGTLAIGAPADLTLWDDDPLSIPPEALLETRIAGSVVAGDPHLNNPV